MPIKKNTIYKCVKIFKGTKLASTNRLYNAMNPNLVVFRGDHKTCEPSKKIRTT